MIILTGLLLLFPCVTSEEFEQRLTKEVSVTKSVTYSVLVHPQIILLFS